MKIQTFRCDVCKTIKQETNHWWLVDIRLTGHSTLDITPWIEIEAQSDTIGSEWTRFHICGEQCVQKKVSEFLAQAKAAA
jgi:hypothetical protein